MKNKIVKTGIKYYQFDISDKEENKKYLALCDEIKAIGLKKDTHHWINFTYKSNNAFMDKIKTMEKRGVCEIETKFIFSNQWNTSDKSFNLRVYDWSECEFENTDIKEGYYLTDVKELFQLRQDTFKCGYCGKYYTRAEKEKENITFCNSCLDSEYLTEDNLILLRLRRINDDGDFIPLNDIDKIALTEEYHKKQIIGRTARLKQKIIDKKKDLKKDLLNAEKEYKAFMWLINNNVNYDNCIYHNHYDEFCFGWRNALSFDEEQDLKEVLKDFPYKYKLKTQ